LSVIPSMTSSVHGHTQLSGRQPASTFPHLSRALNGVEKIRSETLARCEKKMNVAAVQTRLRWGATKVKNNKIGDKVPHHRTTTNLTLYKIHNSANPVNAITHI
jgi:hypothetical protein